MPPKKNIESNTNICDFCFSHIKPIYSVPESAKGAIIHVCTNCGLVQTIYTKGNKNKIKSASSGANWGNIRHGKGLRFEQIKSLLANDIPWKKTTTVLDIGSNRGDFVTWIAQNQPKISIIGIEPDASIVNTYKSTPKFVLHLDRFENINLVDNTFDLVFCFHTLEHADSASAMLKKIQKVLKPGGILVMEIPSILVIADSKIVEEYFIDKHSFHFNPELLVDYLENLGFDVIVGDKKDSSYNFTVVAKKDNKTVKTFKKSNPKLVTFNQKLIKNYATNLEKNRIKLQKVGEKINMLLERQKVAFWGGGRVFDALVKYGELNTSQIFLLIDAYLSGRIEKHHGILIETPDVIKFKSPDVFIILANSSEDAIYENIRRYGYINIIKFRDLLENEG